MSRGEETNREEESSNPDGATDGAGRNSNSVPSGGTNRWQLFKEIGLSVVTLTFLIITGFWLSPDKAPSTPLKKQIVEPIKVFWLFWGLEQNWALFSPVIKDINYHTVGVITRQDGSNEIWEFPRMDKLDLFTKFRLEKYRKWSIDSLPWPDHKQFWPYIARYIGRQTYRQDNPPVKFALLLFWTKIPPPATAFTERAKLPPHTKCNNVFTYEFSKEDFQ
jgi:hypothetical protein